MDRPGKQKIACAITHMNEITLGLCLESIKRQTVQIDHMHVVASVTPASAAFNKCLDFALEKEADVLIHLAADCILASDAFDLLLKDFEPSQVYALTGQGFDMMNGENAPIGIWALNMQVIGDRFRFRDMFKMDLDFCARIEAETGLSRAKSRSGRQLGYHHPIWLPAEMYRKFRYNAQKYRSKEVKKYLRFFEACLAKNPENSVLKLGLMGLKRGAAETHNLGGPLHDAFDAEWGELLDLVDVKEGDFFAYHADFIDMGKKLLGSEIAIEPMAGNFFPTGGGAARGEPGAGAAATANQLSDFMSGAPSVGLRLMADIKAGKHAAKAALRPIYHRLPAPARDLYRWLRGAPPATQGARLAEARRKNLPMLDYGAMNDGRADWRERWNRATKANRALLVAPKDFAGSMYKWAEALNRHTDIAARLVAFAPHQYDYPVDLIIPECDDERLAGALKLADEAGTVHLKDEHSWFLRSETFANLRLLRTIFFSSEFASTPKIFTHYGGYARKFKRDPSYIGAVQRFDARIAMTPDLNFEWFDGAYIPHAIDMEAHRFIWRDGGVFAHSPSSPEKKATYLFEETVALLPRLYPQLWKDWSHDLISDVSFEDCMRRKQRASLFFDQAGRHRVADLGIDDIIGWYGNSAIEAMAHGIPTMAHLSTYALKRAAAAGVDLTDSPVINIDRTRQAMIDAFVAFARSSPDARADLARRTRDFTGAFHGYEICGARLRQIYRSVAKPIVQSGGSER